MTIREQGEAFERKIDKRHGYHMLDGMRGVAAMAVLAFHMGMWLERRWMAPCGYLAVDFFFCLSGFVIASAYKDRAAKGLPFRRFALMRVVRLWPMILMGLMLGLVIYAAAGWRRVPDAPNGWMVTAAFGLAALMLPNFMKTPMGDNPFPLNGVQWSLFFELAANFTWFAVRPLLGIPMLIAIMAVSAAVLAWGQQGVITGSMGGTNEHFLLGIPRTAYSFCAGLLVYELSARRVLGQRRFSGALLLIALGVVLAMPATVVQKPYELISTFILFPVLVLLGTRGEANGITRWLCMVGERLSYPVYAIHRPLFVMALTALNVAGLGRPGLGGGLVIALMICVVSWLSTSLYDAPVRGWLELRLNLRHGRGAPWSNAMAGVGAGAAR